MLNECPKNAAKQSQKSQLALMEWFLAISFAFDEPYGYFVRATSAAGWATQKNIWLMDHCTGKVMKDVSSQLFGVVETHKFRGGGHRKDEQLEWQVLRKRKLAQKPV